MHEWASNSATDKELWTNGINAASAADEIIAAGRRNDFIAEPSVRACLSNDHVDDFNGQEIFLTADLARL